MGYNYKIQYCASNLNIVPDTLSQAPEFCSILSLSAPLFNSVAAIDRACAQDPEAQAIKTALQQGHAPTLLNEDSL